MKDLAYLNKYLWKYKYRLFLGIGFISLYNFFATYPAQNVRASFDMVEQSLSKYKNTSAESEKIIIYDQVIDSLFDYGINILFMALLAGVFLFLSRQTLIVMSRLIEYDLKNELYTHYQNLSLSFYRRNSTGDLMARMSEDVGKVRMYIGPAIMYGMNLISSTICIIVIMISVNAKLTLYVLAPLPLLAISIYFVSRMIEKRSLAIQNSLSSMSTFVQEAFSGIRVIKAFGREKSIQDAFKKESESFHAKSISLTKVQAFFHPLMVAMIGFSVIITVFVGGLEVFDGTVSHGNIAEFVIYVTRLTWPITSMGWITSIIQRAAVSQKRLNELLNEKSEIISTGVIYTLPFVNDRKNASLEFKNVSLQYNSSTEVLKNISFTLPQGKSLGILGSTGSGKSSIANLLCRLYDPTKGEVLIGSRNVIEYDLQSIRSQIAYVPQDVFLFSDTIQNNIAFGTDNSSLENIKHAARLANIAKSIEEFPDQYQTILGERGITLSGGQKQRVSIARALIREPKLLILDDCLSAVDTETEHAILENLKIVMRNKTTVIVSHRVSSVRLADEIIVLDKGEIVERGSHADLYALKESKYRILYDKQMKVE